MKKSQKQAIAVGAGVAALAAAATGAYLLTGKRGAKNRKKIAQWTDKAKKEVVSEIKKMENVSKAAYNTAIDTVAERYQGLKNVDPAELALMVRELKSHWDSINTNLMGARQTVRRAAKKVAPKKPAKKKASKQPRKAPAKKARR